MNKNKDIRISEIQTKIFTGLLIITWSITTIFILLKKDYKHAIIIAGSGAGFIIAFQLIQKYFTKMLINYNENLNMKRRKE